MSSVDSIPLQHGLNHTVGFYLDELMIPLTGILEAGFNVTFANPQGNLPPMDPFSNSSVWFDPVNPFDATKQYDAALALLANITVSTNFASPQLFSTFTDAELANYDAVFVPGGHPPMVDLYQDADLGKILVHFHNNQKPTGMICHGPMASVAASLVQTPWIYENYTMTVYTTSGEQLNELMWGGKLLFYPEDKLRAAGAILSEIEIGGGQVPHVVQDKELVTGMNPFSAPQFAQQFVGFLQQYCSSRAN